MIFSDDLRVWPREQTVSLSGELLGLRQQLQAALSYVGLGFAPRSEEHSLLRSPAELERSGWLQSFPHLALVTAPIDPAAAAAGELVLAPAQAVLAPAACTGVYPAHAGEELAAPLYVKLCSQAFRSESSFQPLRRQRSFWMYELVCLGTPVEVETFLESTRAEVSELMARLGIEITWELGLDPFYRPDAPAALMQRIVPLKREAVLRGDDLAIASVNLHNEHFGTAFGITRGGAPATSGCVAFGLERWVWAWCAAHGTDPASWPNPLALAGAR